MKNDHSVALIVTRNSRTDTLKTYIIITTRMKHLAMKNDHSVALIVIRNLRIDTLLSLKLSQMRSLELNAMAD